MKNICFFNHWHNGDVFAGKGWMQAIAKQYPDLSYAYAQINNPKIMQDLGFENIHCNDLPDDITDRYKIAVADDEIYINTWIGSYGWDVMPRGEDHANWLSLHKMFESIAGMLNSANDMNISIEKNPLKYVPTTDWSCYDIAKADQYFDTTVGNRFHLICNGLVRSTQSNLGTMKTAIEMLAQKYPEDVFVCTARFETNLANIHFTDDVFGLDNDINEIAYFSTRCSTIVGKNSGPFMFCHVKDNMFDENKAFVSLSHRPSDCYPHGLAGFDCHYFHQSSDDEALVTQAIDTAIQSLDHKGPGKVEILS
jgi:hypothetical protein